MYLKKGKVILPYFIQNMDWTKVLRQLNVRQLAEDECISLSQEEWKARLSPEVFHVLRMKGTERPNEGAHCSVFEPGIYECAGCGQELFDSSVKYDSRSGWPSFTEAIHPQSINYIKDNTFGMSRVEVACSKCDGHLGHIFPDGPAPSGLRFCINSISLVLQKN